MPMKRFLFTSLVLSTLLLSACSPFRSMSGSSYDYDDYESTSSGYYPESEGMMGGDKYMADSTYDLAAPSTSTTVTEDRKIIKTGSLNLHVESVQEAMPVITKLVEDAGGNVDSSNITRGYNSYSANMTVRVPSDQFDASMTAFKEQAVYVESEYTNASDVTEYYTDLETRLSNKQAEETQYLEILKKAETVTDILSVTQYLSNVRYEIESLQGQINSYDSQIDRSTITLYLGEDESVSAVSETWKPLSTLREAASDWIVFLQGGVDGLIYLVIFGWPLLVVAWAVRRWLRRNRKAVRK